MSSIHYFQRYSQRENVATNNTLLLLSRLYQHSPNNFKGFLNELLEDTALESGILFNQQVGGSGSTPDGNISQISFKVVIETKLHQNFSVPQLIEHLNSFGKEEYKILLSLSPKLPSDQLQKQIETEVQKFNNANNTSVKYIPTTFQSIIEKLRKILEDYEYDIIPIVDDFEEYCIEEKLISDDEYRMWVLGSGWTLDENFKYNLYYRNIDSGYSDHSYIGMYNQKSIIGIGKLTNIIEADLLTIGGLQIKNHKNIVSKEQEQNIIGVIAAAKINNGWDISKGHNFFCVDKFYKTDFRKETKYPLPGTKYFNLKEVLNLKTLPSTEEIAELLKKVTW